MNVVDLCAGPGGWDLAVNELGLSPLGVEYDEVVVETRRQAGLETLNSSIADIDDDEIAAMAQDVKGLIASPPCKAYSRAGGSKGRNHLDTIISAIRRGEWGIRPDPDPNIWLVLDVGRWIETLQPDWIAFEQTREVTPIWEAYAEILTRSGYSTWVGLLNAADYGTPQVRNRVFMLASRVRAVGEPPPTHAEVPSGDLQPWVPMARALKWKIGHELNAPRRVASDTQIDLSWPWRRPSTTIASRGLVIHPGENKNRFNESSKSRNDSFRITVPEMLVLQGFPFSHPVAGNKRQAREQVGNAVPVQLARAALREVTGIAP